VLEGGHILVPNHHFLNDDGVYVFVAADREWRQRPRPRGRYVSTAWIPGNLLSEGTMIVGSAITTPDPEIIHFFEREAVAFEVIDSLDGDSVRGEYAGPIPGVVRPMLEWETRFTPAECETVTAVSERLHS
jgi:lipopolysaccharide transport system ATP-binding protein